MFQQSDSGSSAAAKTVLFDLETVYDHLARLIKDMGELPNPDDVAKHSGASYGAASKYYTELQKVTWRAAAATKEMQKLLIDAEVDIRKAVEALAAHDTLASGIAESFQGAVDGSAQLEAAPPVPGIGASIASSAAPTNDSFGI